MKKLFGILSVAVLTMAFVVEKSDSSVTVNTPIQSESGIRFKNVSLERAKELAAETDKLIFIDAYTSWCGPCKRMAATSFKDDEVGEIFNDKFVNLKIDMEKDADGPEVAKLYKVRAYPTLLIIDSKGKLVKSSVGFMTSAQLLSLANSVD